MVNETGKSEPVVLTGKMPDRFSKLVISAGSHCLGVPT